jgi:alpha-1,2-mannosyltransferase
VAAAVAVDVAATWLLAGALGATNDLFPRWYGARAWLLDGLDPYSSQVDDGIRQAMGGAPGEGLGAFVFGFVYPGYVALLLAPLAVLPFRVAATIWLLAAQVAVCLGTALVWRMAGDPAPASPARPAGRAASLPLGVIAAAVLFPGSLLNLAFGQFAALVYLALAAGCWLLGRGRPRWAGVVVALALVKPSVALLPSAALLVHAVWWRRWRFALTWAVAVLLLLAASLVALPDWPAAFWRSTVDYARVASAMSAAGLLAAVVGPADPQGRALLTVLIGAGALAAAAWGWARSLRRPADTLGAAILAGSWLVPPLYEWNSLLLLAPLLLRLSPAATGRLARRLVWVCLGAAFLLSLVAVAARPFESRLLWPAIALFLWSLPAVPAGERQPGTKNVTERAGTSPSVPAAT